MLKSQRESSHTAGARKRSYTSRFVCTTEDSKKGQEITYHNICAL